MKEGGLNDLINFLIGYEALFCRRAASTCTTFLHIVVYRCILLQF